MEQIKTLEELKLRLIAEGDHNVFIPDFVKKYAKTRAVKPLLNLMVQLMKDHCKEFGAVRTSWKLINRKAGEHRRMPRIDECYISHVVVIENKGKGFPHIIEKVK